MTTQELSQIRAYIKGAYPTTRDHEGDDMVWFDMLKDYEYFGILQAVKSYIKAGNKYAPTVAELIKGYELILDGFNEDIIDRMARAGVFDDPEFITITDLNGITRMIATESEVRIWNKQKRLDSARAWLSRNNMPDWFKAIYEQYRNEYRARYFGGSNIKKIDQGVNPL